MQNLQAWVIIVSGKSLIGGRKALENRRFIKHLTSDRESTGFEHDLNKAISRILGEKKPLGDKNKGRRNVIKHQTQETKYSLTESILRAKVGDKFVFTFLSLVSISRETFGQKNNRVQISCHLI